MSIEKTNSTNYTHLWAGLAAMVVVPVLLALFAFYAQGQEQRYVHALAPLLLDQTMDGTALQRAALKQKDLLPIFGSSEMSFFVPRVTAPDVFRDYPTGFAPFIVARGGDVSLSTVQNLAALGLALKGMKVVLSFTPTVYFYDAPNRKSYGGVFSRLHANELAFSTDLNPAVKQLAAQHMLQYPLTVADDPVLRVALNALTDDSLRHKLVYALLWPLGKVQTWALGIQDHWLTMQEIWKQPKLDPKVPRQQRAIDWPMMIAEGRAAAQAHSTNNPYGLENRVWNDEFVGKFKPAAVGSKEKRYRDKMVQAEEWSDLEMVLQTLHQYGAQVLVMSMPANGPILDAMGQSPANRQAYYDRLEQLAAKYDMPVVDFRQFDEDGLFNHDAVSHPSREGWMYVNQVLDQYYHGHLPQSKD